MTKINSQDWIQKKVGNYRIILEISRGKNGVVFLAANEQTKEKVALKIFSSPKPSSEILESIKKSAELSHIGLVKIFDYGSLIDFYKQSASEECSKDLSDCYYIAMEYVGKLSSPGATFDSQKNIVSKNFIDFISNSSQYLNEKIVINLLFQLLDILEYLHGADGENSQGTPFGRIYPKNILIEELNSGKFKLRITEFGILINNKTNSESDPFLSSEEIQEESLTQKSDIYSIGAIAYALITGVPPQSTIAPPSQIRTDILPDWDKLIQQTLAYDANDRLENYKEFRKQLLILNKYVTKPWIRPMISGIYTAASIIGILVICYFGYKIFEDNKSSIQDFTGNTVDKTSNIFKSKNETKKSNIIPEPTNLLETSEVAVAGQKTEIAEPQLQPTTKSPDHELLITNELQTTKPKIEKLLKHTVKKGETLWSISQKHYLTTAQLLKINNLPTNTIIKAGQLLNLVAEVKQLEEKKEKKTYKVQKGETYYSISRKFKCNLKKLQLLNKDKTLKIGQEIKLP